MITFSWLKNYYSHLNKTRGFNIIMKLDMSKAYDSISWLALIKILRKFGFNERTIDMIWRLISNYWYSVLINEKAVASLHQTEELDKVTFYPHCSILLRQKS